MCIPGSQLSNETFAGDNGPAGETEREPPPMLEAFTDWSEVPFLLSSPHLGGWRGHPVGNCPRASPAFFAVVRFLPDKTALDL